MSWDDPNMYYNPEKFGLTIVGTIAYTDDYEHDYFTVWKDGEGRFGWGTSAGCSCVSPFEDYTIDDLKWGDVNSIKAAFEADLPDHYRSTDEMNTFRMEFVDLVTRMVS